MRQNFTDSKNSLSIFFELNLKCLFYFHSFIIQHVPDGFIVNFDRSDVDEILLLQKKSSESSEWQDIHSGMEEIDNYKRFEIRGEEKNSSIDMRLITTRKCQNNEQPYLIFIASDENVYSKSISLTIFF